MSACQRCGSQYYPTGTKQKYCFECGEKARKEYYRIYGKVWRKEHPDYGKMWRVKNKAKLKERSRLYYLTHYKGNFERKRKVSESVRKWREKHREEHRKHNGEWRKKNKSKVNFMNRRREFQLRGAMGFHTYQEWLQLKAQYNHTCLSCRKKEPQITLTQDHIIPISKGGSDNITNIQPLCGQCNSEKWASIV